MPDSCLNRVRALWAGLGLLLAVPQAAAQAEGFGALQPYLLLGSDPPWIGMMNGDDYRLSNSSNDGDVLYFLAPVPDGQAQQIALSVAVQGHLGADHSGAGLIFNQDPGSGTYHAVVLMAGGELALLRRDAQGLEELLRIPLRRTTAGGALRLTLHATATGVDVAANGVLQASIAGVALQGQAGIFASDGGTYLFSDYAVLALGAGQKP